MGFRRCEKGGVGRGGDGGGGRSRVHLVSGVSVGIRRVQVAHTIPSTLVRGAQVGMLDGVARGLPGAHPKANVQ